MGFVMSAAGTQIVVYSRLDLQEGRTPDGQCRRQALLLKRRQLDTAKGVVPREICRLLYHATLTCHDYSACAH